MSIEVAVCGSCGIRWLASKLGRAVGILPDDEQGLRCRRCGGACEVVTKAASRFAEDSDMRRRSQAGSPGPASELADRLVAGTRVPEPSTNAAAKMGQGELAGLVVTIKHAGFDVTLASAEEWSEFQQGLAREWIKSCDMTAVPEFLAAAFKGASNVSGASLLASMPGDFVLPKDAKVLDIAPPLQIVVPTDSFTKGTPQNPKVVETSKELIDEMAKKSEPPPLFASANRGPGIQPDIQRIVESVYAVDAWKDYRDLEGSLEVGDERGDYRTLLGALDKGEVRARRAHALYLSAKLALETWERDSDVVMAGMRDRASDVVEDEKAKGDRKKAITNADIEAQIAKMFPDEWKDQQVRRAKLKGTVAHLERLAELCKNRCFTLGTMLSTLRK